jgi:hypothetical protein
MKLSNANEAEESRTADELARSPEDQWDEGSSSRVSVEPAPVSVFAQRSLYFWRLIGRTLH